MAGRQVPSPNLLGGADSPTHPQVPTRRDLRVAPGAIVFDLGNVLLPFDHLRGCRAAARRSPFTPEEIYRRLWGSGPRQGARMSGLVERFDRGRIGARDFFVQVRRLIDYRGTFGQLHHAWVDIFRANPAMERLVTDLAGRYRLVLLSNTNRSHFEHVRRRYPVVGLIRRRVLSYQVGFLKPDPRIYRLAVRKAGCAPAECLYVDDQPDFVAVGAGLGMMALTFRGARRLRSDLERLGRPGDT